MELYENRILPTIINLACSSPEIMKLRQRVVPLCEGTVLEVGAGSGINFPLYDPSRVDRVLALEPSAGMRRKARGKNADQAQVPIEWLELPGELIPLTDQSVDTILLTFTLCSIADYQTALRQMRRVLRPGGQLLFCEHGRAEELKVQHWQDRLNPVWKWFAGGCHLNRPIKQYIGDAGFEIVEVSSHYLPGSPKFAGFVTQGRAEIG
jgi:ubiquinone/menaquinone biosynthesis C-methylase UbiE